MLLTFLYSFARRIMDSSSFLFFYPSREVALLKLCNIMVATICFFFFFNRGQCVLITVISRCMVKHKRGERREEAWWWWWGTWLCLLEEERFEVLMCTADECGVGRESRIVVLFFFFLFPSREVV